MTSQIRLPDIHLKELFVDPHSLQEKLGLTANTLQTLRKEGSLLQGIHYTEVNSRLILYNLPLMIDWLVNRHDPEAHLRAIEQFQYSLLSNHPRRRGRPHPTLGTQKKG
ncbi:MAG: hypothetical protein OHK0012_25990 [Synechococcales cyanobacterium]